MLAFRFLPSYPGHRRLVNRATPRAGFLRIASTGFSLPADRLLHYPDHHRYRQRRRPARSRHLALHGFFMRPALNQPSATPCDSSVVSSSAPSPAKQDALRPPSPRSTTTAKRLTDGVWRSAMAWRRTSFMSLLRCKKPSRRLTATHGQPGRAPQGATPTCQRHGDDVRPNLLSAAWRRPAFSQRSRRLGGLRRLCLAARMAMIRLRPV